MYTYIVTNHIENTEKEYYTSYDVDIAIDNIKKHNEIFVTIDYVETIEAVFIDIYEADHKVEYTHNGKIIPLFWYIHLKLHANHRIATSDNYEIIHYIS